MKISYHGGYFVGFQEQPEGGSVTDALMRAVKTLGIDQKPLGAGRTDRGVHATGQMIALNLPPFWHGREVEFVQRLNRQIAPWIRIHALWQASDDFHPRYDALHRRYRYLFSSSEPTPFLSGFVTFVDPYDAGRIAQAVKLFIGRHNFEWFRKTNDDDDKSFVRTIYRAGLVRRHGFDMLFFEGDAFLRSQIRMMTAFLIAIGQGRVSEEALIRQLEKRERAMSEVAAPQGLYLTGVSYPAGKLLARIV